MLYYPELGPTIALAVLVLPTTATYMKHDAMVTNREVIDTRFRIETIRLQVGEPNWLDVLPVKIQMEQKLLVALLLFDLHKVKVLCKL